MDFTTELLRPLDVLLPSGASLGLVRERPGFGMDYGVFNAFLAVREPRHPFFAAALERSVTVCLARDYGSTPWSITGPELLGRVARDAPRLVRDVTWLRHAPEGGAIETLASAATSASPSPSTLTFGASSRSRMRTLACGSRAPSSGTPSPRGGSEYGVDCTLPKNGCIHIALTLIVTIPQS